MSNYDEIVRRQKAGQADNYDEDEQFFQRIVGRIGDHVDRVEERLEREKKNVKKKKSGDSEDEDD